MLASTVQFSNNTQTEEHPASIRPKQCHHHPAIGIRTPACIWSRLEKTLTCSLRTQQYADIDTAEQSLKTPRYAMSDCQCSTREHRSPTYEDYTVSVRSPSTTCVMVRERKRLLRKEVIQPHLPVRLPCYDFVPIASPTFDGSLHKGWATGFGCCRLS